MKLLVVCSGNVPAEPFDFDLHRPFVRDQVHALRRAGHEVDLFFVRGHGAGGYLRNLPALYRTVSAGGYDVIHAHGGLCGLLAGLQRKVPVVVTFHGSDIAARKTRPMSWIASRRAAWSVFVSPSLYEMVRRAPGSNFTILPCGVDLDVFMVVPRERARATLGLDPLRRYVLFGSSFHIAVKNPILARQVAARLPGIELIELRGYSREQVALLMNACDALLLTSHREGSPQVIKEAMASNCPIVTTDVGDVRETIGETQHCFIGPPDAAVLADALRSILHLGVRTDGRARMERYANARIAGVLSEIYVGVTAGSREPGACPAVAHMREPVAAALSTSERPEATCETR